MAKVLAVFGAKYRREYGDRIPRAHLDAMDSMEWCRTLTLGGHIVDCPECPEGKKYAYHSCNHRSCPKCGSQRTAKWTEDRRKELLPVPYQMGTFTLPEETRRLVRTHQRKLYPAFFQASSETLLEIGADPKYIGGRLGLLGVLHTWSATNEYHPHIHYMIPTVAIGPDGEMIHINPNWLAPQKVLAARFRKKFVALARAAVPGIEFPGSVFHKDWVVDVQPGAAGDERALRYLARYVHRTGMSDHRIVDVTEKEVVFRYRDRQKKKFRKMRLPGKDFLRRTLQHVLPKGFHKVRYYGFWSPGARARLLELKERLTHELAAKIAQRPSSPSRPATKLRDWLLCPSCKARRVIVGTFLPIPRWARAAPT